MDCGDFYSIIKLSYPWSSKKSLTLSAPNAAGTFFTTLGLCFIFKISLLHICSAVELMHLAVNKQIWLCIVLIKKMLHIRKKSTIKSMFSTRLTVGRIVEWLSDLRNHTVVTSLWPQWVLVALLALVKGGSLWQSYSAIQSLPSRGRQLPIKYWKRLHRNHFFTFQAYKLTC